MDGPSVTVITPTVQGRERLLEECVASVEAQTVKCHHLVGEDAGREGPGAVRNRLAGQAETRWLLLLDDDDTLDPGAAEALLAASVGADIVYPWCRMVGRTDGWVPNRLFNPESLFRMNFIPNTVLVDRDTWGMLGGHKQVPMEDWDFYRRAWLHGCGFRCVPEVLWSYRFHGGNHFQGQR